MRSFSILTLIAANLIPLFGVLFYQWDTTLVLALFWIENLIIGGFNLAKMLILTLRNKQLNGLFLSAFFVFHFGFFCSAHGFFLWGLLDLGEIKVTDYFDSVPGGPLRLFAEGATVLFSFIEMHGSTILLGISALLLSHLVSFIENFILRGEIHKLDVSKLMARPYGQIIAMHAGLILGAFAIEKFGSTVALLTVLVAFKFAIDIAQYVKRRTKTNAVLNENMA